jgi:hypothetical protein
MIPASWEAEIERIIVPGQLGQKLVRPYLNKWLGMMVCIFIPAMQGSTKRRIVVQVGLVSSKTPSEK